MLSRTRSLAGAAERRTSYSRGTSARDVIRGWRDGLAERS